MRPIRAKIDGDTQAVMVVRVPEKVGDTILVAVPAPTESNPRRRLIEEYKVTGVDNHWNSEKRWHLEKV